MHCRASNENSSARTFSCLLALRQSNGQYLYDNAGVLGNKAPPVGSAAQQGVLQGDGSTTTISAGTISCTTATASQIGCVKPDGTTVTISGGVISASGGSAKFAQSGRCSALPVAAGTEYCALIGNAAASSTTGTISMVWPATATLGSLYVTVSGFPGSGKSWEFELDDLTSSTAGCTCTIANTSTNCTPSGTLSVTAGDVVVIEVITTGSPGSASAYTGVGS
jgi:hypothetical protein